MTSDPSEDEPSGDTTPVPGSPDPYLGSEELPRELKDFTKIYFEEQLCTCRRAMSTRDRLLNGQKIISLPIYFILLPGPERWTRIPLPYPPRANSPSSTHFLSIRYTRRAPRRN